MEKELLDFALLNGLSPFNFSKTSLKPSPPEAFRTKDARAVFSKVLSSVSSNFVFADSANLLSSLSQVSDPSVIKARQQYFSSLRSVPVSNAFLKGLSLSRPSWKPPYGIVVVTENEDVFVQLQKLNVPVKMLLTDQDVRELEDMDVVQVVECPEWRIALERLPQSVFLASANEVFLERFLSELSRWSEVLNTLSKNPIDQATGDLVASIVSLLPLLAKGSPNKITRDRVEDALGEVRSEIASKVQTMTVSGSSLIEVMSKGVIPDELKSVVTGAITKTGLPQELFYQNIPVTIDEAELEKVLRKQSLSEFSSLAERVRAASTDLIALPKKLRELELRLLLLDFRAGVVSWMAQCNSFPSVHSAFSLSQSKNLFLKNPHPITFDLSSETKCSILTGANSGGKTTLLEHLLQLLSCQQLGLPVSGSFASPIFSEIYYFAKNKGSMSKGAFETLLSQMAKISPGKNTLILADEIEAVTEPGVAGRMICATADYFIKKGCFLVIATHLGHEVQKNLPRGARVDGIEAKGLDENNELIIDHNPRLGVLAHSTPELIVEKMHKVHGGEYFGHLFSELKK